MLRISKGTKCVTKRKNVKELMSLIEKNNYIMELVFLIKRDIQRCMSNDEKEKVVEAYLDIAVVSGRVKQDQRVLIKQVISRFDANDYGELLEIIIERKGPYDKDRHLNEIGRECKFFHNDIQGNYNMDVVFYNSDCKYIKGNNTVFLEGNVELHECKNNISNWLPQNEEELNKDKNKKVKGKLEFFNSIHTILEENGRYYLPTFSIEVMAKQKCLNDWGYSFLKILSISDLQSLF